ncbi:MAG TPA: YciI family protein [Blastocatellia bacterium]|nr:YciI family protein [Blastocatellia bacterium]
MEYMFLIYHDTEGYETVSQETIEACMKIMREIQTEARSKGILKAAAGLGKPNTARTLRMRNGKFGITDGPFAETKEALGGYYIIDCKDDVEAEYWAERIASASGNATIEIRRIDQGGRQASA